MNLETDNCELNDSANSKTNTLRRSKRVRRKPNHLGIYIKKISKKRKILVLLCIAFEKKNYQIAFRMNSLWVRYI